MKYTITKQDKTFIEDDYHDMYAGKGEEVLAIVLFFIGVAAITGLVIYYLY